MAVFHDRLNLLKEEKGIQAKDLATALKITPSKLSYYMRGNSEPPYELLIAAANYFGVTTDYLVGRSNQKSYEDEIKAKSIQAKSDSVESSIARSSEIENYSVRLHDILIKIAKIENSENDLDDVWKMINTWLDSIDNYTEFIKMYKPPFYPLDEAKQAMDLITECRHLATERVFDMLSKVLNDESVDKETKSRVIMRSSFGIRSKTEVNKELDIGLSTENK